MAEKLPNCKAGSILQDTIGFCTIKIKRFVEEEMKQRLTSSFAVLMYCSLIVSFLGLYVFTAKVDLFPVLYLVTAGISWATWLIGSLYLTSKYRVREELAWNMGKVWAYYFFVLVSNFIFTGAVFVVIVYVGSVLGLNYELRGL